MTKQLLIIRHAKSDWDDPKLSDFKRPLNQRGMKNAPEMARRLIKRRVIPDQLISSEAVRALTTAFLFAEELNIDKESVIREPKIYDAFSSDIFDMVTALDNKSTLTAIFGHNPAVTILVKELCDVDLYNIPTCGMALIEFPVDDWKLVSHGSGELLFFDYPKKQD